MLLYWSVLATQEFKSKPVNSELSGLFFSAFSPSFFPLFHLYPSFSLMLGRSRCGFLYLYTRLMYCSDSEPPPGGNYAPLKTSESRRAERVRETASTQNTIQVREAMIELYILDV